MDKAIKSVINANATHSNASTHKTIPVSKYYELDHVTQQQQQKQLSYKYILTIAYDL